MNEETEYEAWYASLPKEIGIDEGSARLGFLAGYERGKTIAAPPGPTGWVCPKCGAGNAPFNPRCSCVGWPELKVTC